MPRANRHFLDGHVWHITHRCHKKEFLLKFSRDRQRWISWLFEARRRYGLCVLDYIVTSNHVHLLVLDTGKDVIAKSMQLIAGRTAQEYNQRKGRKGAFWEDRYHATAVEGDEHLVRCLVYVDLNMVRAGVVGHPGEWSASGYREIQNPPRRYGVVDIKALMELLGIREVARLQREHQQWIQNELGKGTAVRQPEWTESLAVGSAAYVEGIKEKLGIKGTHREVAGCDGVWTLKEDVEAYSVNFGPEMGILRAENTVYLEESC